jgi:hypothetical protein
MKRPRLPLRLRRVRETTHDAEHAEHRPSMRWRRSWAFSVKALRPGKRHAPGATDARWLRAGFTLFRNGFESVTLPA